MTRFIDRVDAGKQLAKKLMHYKDDPEAIVLGLPRGGVVTAYEVATALNVPLDIIVPRKIGAPSSPELAVGAVTQNGEIVWNDELMKTLHLTEADLADIIEKERRESVRRLRVYRGDRPKLQLQDKIAILVDDGVATGATMRAAIASARARGAKRIVAATPLSTLEAMERIEREVDECVCVLLPKIFLGISAFYDEFAQTTDEEVIELLKMAP